MCDHFLGLHARHSLQQLKALWRCSTCGRESRTPIDCCTRPDFAPIRRSSIEWAFVRWLGEMGSRALLSLWVLLHRRRHPTVSLTTVPDHRHRAHEAFEVAAEPDDDAQRMDAQADTEAVVEPPHVSV